MTEEPRNPIDVLFEETDYEASAETWDQETASNQMEAELCRLWEFAGAAYMIPPEVMGEYVEEYFRQAYEQQQLEPRELETEQETLHKFEIEALEEWDRVGLRQWERYKGEEEITLHIMSMQGGTWTTLIVYEQVDSPIQYRAFSSDGYPRKEIEETVQTLISSPRDLVHYEVVE